MASVALHCSGARVGRTRRQLRHGRRRPPHGGALRRAPPRGGRGGGEDLRRERGHPARARRDGRAGVRHGAERGRALYYPNATWVYEVDLAGRRPAASYPPLAPTPPAPVQDGTPVWCVLAGGGEAANETAVTAAVEYACRQRSGTCAAIEAGGECNQPDTLAAHASYAFNAYWQLFRKAGGTCYFNGLAEKTTKDPSKLLLPPFRVINRFKFF